MKKKCPRRAFNTQRNEHISHKEYPSLLKKSARFLFHHGGIEIPRAFSHGTRHALCPFTNQCALRRRSVEFRRQGDTRRMQRETTLVGEGVSQSSSASKEVPSIFVSREFFPFVD